MKLFTGHISHLLATAATLALTLMFTLSSCTMVTEDEPECNQGLALRFVYDYNMEKANAFPAQVHCLTVFIYDSEGRYLTTVTETDRNRLSDESWRMNVDLPEGSYRIMAYGGMACQDASFHFTDTPASGSLYTDLGVEMNADCLTSPVGTELHHLFYGTLETAAVGNNDADYVEYTVRMMKDTNNLRILLQNVDGTPVDDSEFTYTVTDIDNTRFSWDNSLISAGDKTFMPWTRGETTGGYNEDGTTSTVAFAEFSLSRLMTSSAARLNITRTSDGETVLSVPLVNYLLMLKSQEYGNMGSQEFLDRESRWNMIFFLQSGTWITTRIVINGWVVRINDIEGF